MKLKNLHGSLALLGILLSTLTTASQAQQSELGCNPAWSIVPTPNLGSGNNALAHVTVIDPDDVWAVGNAEAGANRNTLALHWTGSSWSLVPSPNGPNPINYLIGVAGSAGNDVWAVGYSSTANQNGQSFTLIERWNGASWGRVASPNAPFPGPFPVSNELYDVAVVSANDAWAVGRTYNVSGGQPLTLHWTGASWTVVRNPDPGLFGVLNAVAAVAADDVWAVGTHYVEGIQRSLIEHWDGTRWQIVPSPNVGTFHNNFLGIHATSSDDVWVVGYHQDVSSQNYQTSILHWDGAGWSVVPSPNENTFNNYLFDVSATSASDAWAVGFYDTGSALLTMAQHWDGSQWTIATSPNPGTFINEPVGAAAASPTDVWATGQFFDGFAFRTYSQRYACPPQQPTMHVGAIVPRLAETRVGARVTIEDAAEAPVPGAVVTVEVTLPNSSKLTRTGTTDSLGRANVAVPRSQSGLYTFTVTGVAKAGFLYDPSANEETSDSIVVP